MTAEKIKILLVDDEDDFRKLMGARISGWDYDVCEVGSGKEAVERIKNNRPDIIILDYMMPEMDGIDTLKEIRRIDPKIPVVMFTAYLDEKPIQEAVELNVSSFVPKISAYTDAIASLKALLRLIANQSKAR